MLQELCILAHQHLTKRYVKLKEMFQEFTKTQFIEIDIM